MPAMAPELDGISMTENVFSSCSSPLSSPPSSPVTVPLFSGRPKRQAAMRAAEKLCFIINEYGSHEDFPHGNKRARDISPEPEDSNMAAKEFSSKRPRIHEPSETLSSDNGNDADIDAEFDVDPELDTEKASAFTANTDVEVSPANTLHITQPANPYQVQMNAQNARLVTHILANLRAISSHQAQTAHQAHSALPPYTAEQVHLHQFMINQSMAGSPVANGPFMVNPSMVDQSTIDQPWYNPTWFSAPNPIISPPQVSPFITNPLPFIPLAMIYTTGQAAAPSIGLPDVNPVSIDHDHDQVTVVNNDQPDDNTSAAISRLPPRGPTPIHSKFRGGICEALPYFKAYKSSCYNVNLVAKGFLIDHEVEKGDIFGETVVIAAVGGNRVREGATMVRAQNASDDAVNVRSLRHVYDHNGLIAIIAGENHPLYPCEPPAAYAVLDWFHITYMWTEKLKTRGSQQAFFTVWRVRFEKANTSTPSWWIPAGHEEIATPTTCPSRSCVACGVMSKEIFTIGWFCLNHNCASFYQISPGQEVDIDALVYSQDFVNERTPFIGEIPSLMPDMPSVNSDQYGTELHLRTGFVCPDCHHACRRLYWNTLRCEIPQCGFRQEVHMVPYPRDKLDAEVEAFEKKMVNRRRNSGVNDPLATICIERHAVRSPVMALGGYIVRQFFLTDPDDRMIGSFTIFRSNEQINARAGGPDELFRTLEVEDIGLRRNPAAVAGHKLEGLTRHFQQNFGARYKFGVSVQSKGFADAPPAILKALKRLDWAKTAAVSSATANLPLDQHALGDDTLTDVALHNQSFNELLALGYMEDDKINYHDDGEKELGPVVAALSLGSPSTMRFRPKRGKGFDTGTRRSRNNPHHVDILEVEMRHGDMMVMAGPAIQRLFEHAVTPCGKRRFALTARFVDPARMEDQADRDDALIKGAIPAHAANFEYDGF
ncbi:hypothetical protein QBC40DRAFT_265647 [Triangularia verruculosa]|uniref:Fe2OG dioxygenase domain-containing protein n=1 Tax=Triangularia verruculosa TaxID=2587418 RepID=A0AAN6XFR7_9PEZI|nr:hypothetical protein QBC40DRAFT_265647 [Triangularia verruculosa]